jgi:hypothetical protein
MITAHGPRGFISKAYSTGMRRRKIPRRRATSWCNWPWARGIPPFMRLRTPSASKGSKTRRYRGRARNYRSMRGRARIRTTQFPGCSSLPRRAGRAMVRWKRPPLPTPRGHIGTRPIIGPCFRLRSRQCRAMSRRPIDGISRSQSSAWKRPCRCPTCRSFSIVRATRWRMPRCADNAMRWRN